MRVNIFFINNTYKVIMKWKTVLDNWEKGIIPKVGFDCVASWVIYARRYKTGHCKVPYYEPFWTKLEPMIRQGNERTLAMDRQIWGDLPKRFESFVPGLVDAIDRMDRKWPI